MARWANGGRPRSRKTCERFGRQHDGDCAFWWGESVASCQCLGHIYALGVFGQSPLPEKIRTILEAGRGRRSLLVGRVRSFAPVQRTHLRVERITTVAATGKHTHDWEETGIRVNPL